MREILFRAYDKGRKEYLSGGNLFIAINTSKHPNKSEIYLDEISNADKYKERFVIEQYTGLTDKNGTKIFEGDIFKFSDEIFESYYTSCGTEYNSWEAENYGVVGFCEDLGRFDFVDYKFNENAVEADLHENHAIEFYDFVSDLEVIGNIHDNPELLKGGGD